MLLPAGQVSGESCFLSSEALASAYAYLSVFTRFDAILSNARFKVDHLKPPFPFATLAQLVAAKMDHFLTGGNRDTSYTISPTCTGQFVRSE